MSRDRAPDGVTFTNLDEPLFAGADATKRDLVDYLDAMADHIIPELRERPLSVIRVLRGQAPFMQKNAPSYAPPWVRTVKVWAETSRREVSYPLCNDRQTLLWFANQRAVEYHPALVCAGDLEGPTYLVVDLDPPMDNFSGAVQAAFLIRQVLTDVHLVGAVKTSGAKGVHVYVPVEDATFAEAAAATRAIAARAERLDPALTTTAFMKDERAGKVFIDFDPGRLGHGRVRLQPAGLQFPASLCRFPVEWDQLDRVTPRDFTVHTAPRLVTGGDVWADLLLDPQRLDAALVDEGRAIPVARVQAMHEGRRRARAGRAAGE